MATTIIDECGQQSTTGQSLSFCTGYSIAAFDSPIAMGCKRIHRIIPHNGNNGTNSWQWILTMCLQATCRINRNISRNRQLYHQPDKQMAFVRILFQQILS